MQLVDMIGGRNSVAVLISTCGWSLELCYLRHCFNFTLARRSQLIEGTWSNRATPAAEPPKYGDLLVPKAIP